MTHAIHKVHSFEVVEAYTLRVRFDDGVERTIDFRPVLAGRLFGPLRDPALFLKVALDPVAHTLVWPNGADFDPETLHDWPAHIDELARMARTWEEGASPGNSEH